MDYAVVIATLNRKKILGNVIDSIYKQTIKPKEFIIMMDNGSEIENLELLSKYKKKYPDIKIYYLNANLGACALINMGVKRAKSSFILNIDDDAVLLNDNWIEVAYKNFRNKIGLVWGNPAGILEGGVFGEFFIGCAFLTRKDIFEEVGMFDEKLFIYSNDTDLSIRLNKRGYRVLSIKKIKVYHPFAPKGPKFYEYASSNRLLLYWKYYPYWVSFVMTILHALRELQEMEDYSLLKYWLKGIKRFFSKFYIIGLKSKEHMNIREFFMYSYQLKFPSIGYKLVKWLYRLKK